MFHSTKYSSFGKHLVLLAIIFCGLASVASRAVAQKIEPVITINLDKASDIVKPYWKDVDKSLQRYLTNPPWHENPFDYVVPLNIGILVDQVNESSIERTYKTFVLASNGSDVQFSDKRWVFPLPEWRSVNRGTFQPLTSLIDFYTLLILAAEFDKWDPFGGDSWYTKARAVCDQGKFDTRYSTGWGERSDLLNELVSQGSRPYRMFRYYAFTGQYLAENNPGEAKPLVDSAFVMLKSINSEDRKQFLGSSARVLADAAYRMNNRMQLETLAANDTATATICRGFLDKLSGIK